MRYLLHKIYYNGYGEKMFCGRPHWGADLEGKIKNENN